MKLPLAIVLAGALALAGCFSEEPVESAAEECTATAGSGSASASCGDASASAGSGSASASGGGASASAGGSGSASASGESVTLVTVPFSAEGSTAPGAAVCAPPMGCQGQELPSSSTNVFDADIEGFLVGAELTMTWDASSPASEEMIVGIAYETEEGNTDWLTARGTSPLVLSVGAVSIPASKVLGVYANGYNCQGQVVVFGCVSAEQAFTIEGTLTTASSA